MQGKVPMGPLEVRARRLPNSAVGNIELMVHCPLRDEPRRLDDCVGCRHCRGLRIDPVNDQTMLICDADETEGKSSEGFERGDLAPAERVTIAEIMTPAVICLDPDVSVEAAAAVFLERGISGAPVVDEEGTPIGIVSKTDLLRQRYGALSSDASLRVRGEGYEFELGAGIALSGGENAVVSDIMMPMVFALPQNETVARAAALMAFENVHRVTVVGPDGKVAGILSSLDVLRWLARQAGFVMG